MLLPVYYNTFAMEMRGFYVEQLELGAMQMNARPVGLRLVELARANQDANPVEELYDANIVSIEVMGGANDELQVGTGIDAN